jgi:hypothetical protein
MIIEHMYNNNNWYIGKGNKRTHRWFIDDNSRFQMKKKIEVSRSNIDTA